MTISSSTSYVVEHQRQLVERAEHGNVDALLAGRDRTEEAIVDAAARSAEHAMQVRDVAAGTDEHRTSREARHAEDVARHETVARTQRSDEHRREDEPGREDRERREVVADADAEGEREDGDDDKPGHDLPEAAAPVAFRVHALLPEHEHEHEREERKPLGLRIAPDQPPEDRT